MILVSSRYPSRNIERKDYAETSQDDRHDDENVLCKINVARFISYCNFTYNSKRCHTVATKQVLLDDGNS